MKRVAMLSIMIAVFVISASIATGGSLYTPWVVETMDLADPTSGSFNTGIYLMDTSGAGATETLTLRKVGAATTSTAITVTVLANDTWWTTFRALTNTPTNWYGTAVVKIANMEITNGGLDLVGFVARFKPNYAPIYSEKLWAWDDVTGSD